MAARPRPINLMRGWPSPDVLPASLLSAACARVLAHPAQATPALQYGPNAGHPSLREGLARWLARHYGVDADARRICVTGGASQSLACILESFTDPHYTRAVWIVAPCYYLACGIFKDAGLAGKLRATPEDDEGIHLGALETSIRELDEQHRQRPPQPSPVRVPGPARKLYRHVIYAVPTCSNPSGKTMSLRRRQGLVRLARTYDGLVITDDVYDFLQWPLDDDPSPHRGPQLRLPRLCDIDLAMGPAHDDPGGFGYAVSNGSFSKIAGPGVRTGWVEASPAFVTGLANAASTLSGGAPSQLCAAILADLVQSGELERHIETVLRPSLQQRHRLMLDAVRRHLAPLGIRTRETSLAGKRIYGGYFLWLTPDLAQPDLAHLPPSRLVANVALDEENLVVGHGSMFEVDGDEESASFDREIRLCFSWEPQEDLVQGVQRLANVLRRMRDNPDSYEWMGLGFRGRSFMDAYK